MANASEAKSIPPPEYSPIVGPKSESAPSEDKCSQGHALVEPKEPPATTAKAVRVMRIRKAPPAALTQVDDTSVEAHSTRDAQVKQDGDCSGTDRPYACPVCHERYYSLAWLRRHIVCHEREKTLRCDQCGRSYKARSALARHRAHVHGLQSPGITFGPQ
ncbi:hypothetical protein HPB51_026506 [Rhipicephalus microplus]|uniref:C2H2-type domain-containing protein n=1 Tax=Rhipicephalus microplus TaxID=6941 RepID=A0A9J6D2X3_RHIMP|nr:hypothetical protein HPB51_026506 [Rhipicephalus microplus]